MIDFPLRNLSHTITLIPKEGETLEECQKRQEEEIEAVLLAMTTSQKMRYLGEGVTDAVAAEREACAKIADEHTERCNNYCFVGADSDCNCQWNIAQAIRTRGKA